MNYPVKKVYITQEWGVNGDIYDRFGFLGHNGVDLRIYDEQGKRATNGNVYAPHDGVVKERRNDAVGYGNYLKIESDVEGSILGHLKEFRVNINTHVKQGDLVAISNNTGWSTGSHVHWGYYRHPRDRNNGYGGTIDPTPYIEEEDMSEFGNMVYKSTQHDETVKYIWGDDVDPRQKSSKDIQQYIGGLKSQITTTQNKNAECTAIVKTQEQQISTLEGRVAQRDKENLDLQTAYNRITKEINDLRVSAESQVRVLEESIDNLILEQKAILESNAVLETKLANCKAGNTTSCWATFIENIKKLFERS